VKKAVALASLSLALAALPVRAERTVAEIRWSALKEEGRLLSGDVVPAGADVTFESLRVANPEGLPRVLPLFTVDRPEIEGFRWVLRGEVRGEGIDGRAYLEMWNFLPGGGRFFSRTLGDSGPMGSLSGTFGFRGFILPFTAEPGMKPERLAVNVAFPGKGTVFLGPLRLVDLGPGDDFFLPAGSWLTSGQIGLVGGIGGGVLGLLGAAVGILASLGRARAAVLAILRVMLAIGVACLVALVVGWSKGQPFPVLFPFLLVGLIGTAVPAGLIGQIRRRYDDLEFRRMKALDVG